MHFASSLTPFNAAQVVASCHLMLDIARTDGLVDAERQLIQGFWESNADSLGPFDAAASGAWDAALFVHAEHKQLLLDMCLACAFADGQLSSGEKAKLSTIAEALGIDAAALEARCAEMRANFLGALAHLPDTAAIAALGKDLA